MTRPSIQFSIAQGEVTNDSDAQTLDLVSFSVAGVGYTIIMGVLPTLDRWCREWGGHPLARKARDGFGYVIIQIGDSQPEEVVH